MIHQAIAERQTSNMGATRHSVVIILVSITALAIGVTFFIALAYFTALDRETADVRRSLYEQSLNDMFARYQYLPFVLAKNPLVKNSVEGTPITSLNGRLLQFAEKSELEAIYLMDKNGVVLNASNFNTPQSFMGQNYGFRPYFKQAMAGERGTYFGVGATTGRSGYFISEPVYSFENTVVGVVAIKVDVSQLQQRWEAGGENVFASNGDGIVVLSSNRDWLFGSLTELTGSKLEAIKASKQFGAESITPLDWSEEASGYVSIDDSSYVYSRASVPSMNWNIHYMLSESRPLQRALLTTLVFGGGIAVLVGFATYLRSKRIQSALETSQQDRKKLIDTNRELESAHDELARTSKLAALGQLSASVVHELGQPISALRNYLTAEELGAGGTPHPAQAKLNSVVDRMESITKQLRFFTKPGDQKLETVPLKDVLANSVDMMRHGFEIHKIKPHYDFDRASIVFGNKMRLEQVIINLLQNALLSLNEAGRSDLKISLVEKDNRAVIKVEDNGVGFGNRDLKQLQEPFHTTRSSGDGMGLGLSIASAIIKEHEGTISAQNRDDGGAIFEISLPLATTGAIDVS